MRQAGNPGAVLPVGKAQIVAVAGAEGYGQEASRLKRDAHLRAAGSQYRMDHDARRLARGYEPLPASSEA